jgi:hypothetical protein
VGKRKNVGRLSRVPPARAVRSVSQKDARPHLVERSVELSPNQHGRHHDIMLPPYEAVRVDMGLLPTMTCHSCRYWADKAGCRRAYFWICFGLYGHPKIYPPPGWEQK